MPALPASVRLALWVTAAWAGRMDLREAVARASPDLDHVGGDLDRLELWQSLGEQALLVGLPSPGDLTGIPVTSVEAGGAAVDAGECVYVPGLGGMLVPEISEYGSEVEPGLRVDWHAHDAQPVPRHRIEALDPSGLERHLRERLLEATEELDRVGGRPFAGEAARSAAEDALSGRWGLPTGIPGRLLRTLSLAGTVAKATEVAVDQPDDALEVSTSGRRRALLVDLQRTADSVLADATNASCAVLAGWRPA